MTVNRNIILIAITHLQIKNMMFSPFLQFESQLSLPSLLLGDTLPQDLKNKQRNIPKFIYHFIRKNSSECHTNNQLSFINYQII